MLVLDERVTKRPDLTEALLEVASMRMWSKEMSLVRTRKVFQHGELRSLIPWTSTFVALSVKKRIGR